MKGLAHIVVAMVVAIMLAACANIGSPEGGPRDYTPPRVVKTSPQAGATNVKGNRVEIYFNEIVNIKDQMKKVSVSPVQKNQPVIKSLGKRIVVDFRDDMQPNTTYTIDFANSIEDNNEGNQLDGYAFSFSTGDEIDTMRISGIVLRAKDLEPMQHVLVGAYSQCLDDTAFTRLPMERITRTNSRGEFTLMGLKLGGIVCLRSTTWMATITWPGLRTMPSLMRSLSRRSRPTRHPTPSSHSTTASTRS